MIRDLRKSVVSLRGIKKSEKLTKENIGIKRPGTGLPPKEYESILGKKTKHAIRKDSLIQRADYASFI